MLFIRGLILFSTIFLSQGSPIQTVEVGNFNSAKQVEDFLKKYQTTLYDFVSELKPIYSGIYGSNVEIDYSTLGEIMKDNVGAQRDVDNLLDKYIPTLKKKLNKMEALSNELYTPDRKLKQDLVKPLVDNDILSSISSNIRYLYYYLSWLSSPTSSDMRKDAYQVIYNCYKRTYDINIPIRQYYAYKTYYDRS